MLPDLTAFLPHGLLSGHFAGMAALVFGAALTQGIGGIGFAMVSAPISVLLYPELVPGPLLVLGNGFILTAVLWGSALVFIIERRVAAAAAVFAVASLATLCGLVHSPLPSGAVFWPWSSSAPLAVAAPLAGAYGALAALALMAAGRARAR